MDDRALSPDLLLQCSETQLRIVSPSSRFIDQMDFSFQCTYCHEVHEGSPSFGFTAPDPYVALSEEQKQSIASLTDDLCVIRYGNGTVDRFIRAVLEVPIHGIDRPFLWGIWVSASEQSFDRYVATFDDPIEGDGFFGWISNRIPEYPVESMRSGDVYIQMGQQRPKVLLHQPKQGIDQLFIDQQQGIPVDRAQFLTEKLLHKL